MAGGWLIFPVVAFWIKLCYNAPNHTHRALPIKYRSPGRSRKGAGSMETITSRQNPLMTHIRKLAGSAAYRRQTGQCLCDSPKLLREAAQWGRRCRPWCRWSRGRSRCRKRSGRCWCRRRSWPPSAPPRPPGVLFTCRVPVLPVPETLPGRRYVVLDGVQDPGNVGTVLRTLDAFDADGLLLTGGCADPFGPKTVRASMGRCSAARCGA